MQRVHYLQSSSAVVSLGNYHFGSCQGKSLKIPVLYAEIQLNLLHQKILKNKLSTGQYNMQIKKVIFHLLFYNDAKYH